MICPKCGEENKNDALECSLCHEKFYNGPLKDCFGNEIKGNPLFTEIPKQTSSLKAFLLFFTGIAVGGGAIGGSVYALNSSGGSRVSSSKDIECIRADIWVDGSCNFMFTEYANYDCKDGSKFRKIECRSALAGNCQWLPGGKVYHSCSAIEMKSSLPIGNKR